MDIVMPHPADFNNYTSPHNLVKINLITNPWYTLWFVPYLGSLVKLKLVSVSYCFQFLIHTCKLNIPPGGGARGKGSPMKEFEGGTPGGIREWSSSGLNFYPPPSGGGSSVKFPWNTPPPTKSYLFRVIHQVFSLKDGNFH